MESLLAEADAWVAACDRGEEPPPPDFTIPEEYATVNDLSRNAYLELKESVPMKKGRGWFAKQDIPAGTMLLICKPIGMVMDWEDEEGGEGGRENQQHQEQQPAGISSEEQNYEDEDAIMDDDDSLDDANPANDDGDTNDDQNVNFEDLSSNSLEYEEEEDDGRKDSNEEEEPEPHLNEILMVKILGKLLQQPTLWEQQLSTLYPRTEADLASLPTSWVCNDDTIFMQVEQLIHQLEQSSHFTQGVAKEIAKRLPLIIRYNILSVETCSELLSYPGEGGHSDLAGVGLYHLPSFFNHSPKPNCSRWAIGDVMAFVTNQNVPAGSELCISYIEHDVLCESPFRRNRMLRMDFHDKDDNNVSLSSPVSKEEEDGPELPVVDTDVQNELMSMNPFERLSAIDELLQQARGEKLPSIAEGEEEGIDADEISPKSSVQHQNNETDHVMADDEKPSAWFQCDIHNLCILKAITLDVLGQTRQALHLWEEAISFVESSHMPPVDESAVVLRTQAALCALHLYDQNTSTANGNNNHNNSGKQQRVNGEDLLGRAREHAGIAVQTHNVLFGGGVARFRRRLARDLILPIRPSGTVQNQQPADFLWPIV